MADKKRAVPRPLRKGEYEIRHASISAEKGWRDLVATQRNAMAQAWDHLTKTPDERDETRCYPLKGDLGSVTIKGVSYTRWQYKPTAAGSARIWYVIVHIKGGGYVLIEDVHTHHPSQTL
ncbi:MAG: hypothetical protein GX610_10180 [Rhodococcus sp.]|nr:hypothetical protein [Rhodococcus sp. (in: high G+C Gram-positive bacteria)]